MTSRAWKADVVVIGGGNAALCAALTARQAGASVLVFECAPREYRGGNSRHTRNMRTMHQAPTEVLTGSYTEDEYFADVLRVTEGQTNEQLARLVIRESPHCGAWMRQRCIRHTIGCNNNTRCSNARLYPFGFHGVNNSHSTCLSVTLKCFFSESFTCCHPLQVAITNCHFLLPAIIENSTLQKCGTCCIWIEFCSNIKPFILYCIQHIKA